MDAYLIVGRRSVWIGETELGWLVESLPSTRLALDVHTLLDDAKRRKTVRITVTDEEWERQAIRAAAIRIREQHPRSASALAMRELERLLER